MFNNSSSVTLGQDKYPLPKTRYFNEFANIVAGAVLAATITATPSTLPTSVIVSDTAVLSSRNIQGFRRSNGSKSAISDFTTALYKRSRPMTAEESKSIRRLILSKSKPGIPKF